MSMHRYIRVHRTDVDRLAGEVYWACSLTSRIDPSGLNEYLAHPRLEGSLMDANKQSAFTEAAKRRLLYHQTTA